MRHAVILAHPRPTCFCASVARTCVRRLRDLGHTASVRDLYRMNFDPRLQARELPGARNHAPGEDVLAERRRLSGVDSFIFVYPFWFNAPPAILKGYVDRVFSLGFGYRPSFHGTEPLLKDRILSSFSTSGAPEAWVDQTGALRNLMAVFDLHVAAVTGMTVGNHTHLGGVVPSLPAVKAREMLGRVEAEIGAAFGPVRA